MLNTILNLLLEKVLDYNFGQEPKPFNTELNKIKVLEPLVYNYLLNLYLWVRRAVPWPLGEESPGGSKVNKVSSKIISKLIICNIFKDNPQDSLN
jgi:hypothetical protein